MNLAKLGLVLNSRGRLTRPKKTFLALLEEEAARHYGYKFDFSEHLRHAFSNIPTPISLLASDPSNFLFSTTSGKASAQSSRPIPGKKNSESLSEYIERAKKKLDLIDIDEDISQMDLATLRKYFGYKNGNIKLGVFCRNVVWQIYRFTQAGKPPQFVVKGGNVRSLRYHVKTITLRHAVSFGRTTDFHPLFGEALSVLTGAGLMSYRDLNFIDTNRVNRWVAPSYGAKNIIAIAEKRSFAEELIKVGKTLGVSVQCTGGLASRVTVETMLLEMADQGHNLTEPFIVFAMVDFDPDGWNVAASFVQQMLELGLSKVRGFWPYGRKKPRQPWIDIVAVKDLDIEFVDQQRHRLPAGRRSMSLADEWIQATGGLYGRGGKKWALSSEAFLGYLEERLESKLKRFLPDDYRYHRIEAFKALSDPLKDYISAKLFSQM